MSDKAELLEHVAPLGQKISAGLSYTTGGGLFLGDMLNFLDSYAGAFGVLIATATYLTNLYYHRKREERERGE